MLDDNYEIEELILFLFRRLIGGHAMFLGSQDIQLGVNESLLDTSKVVSSMVDGIMARVGAHSEIEVGRRIQMRFARALCDLSDQGKIRFEQHQRLTFFFYFILTPHLSYKIDAGKVLDSANHQRPLRPVPPNPNPGRPHDPPRTLHARRIRPSYYRPHIDAQEPPSGMGWRRKQYPALVDVATAQGRDAYHDGDAQGI